MKTQSTLFLLVTFFTLNLFSQQYNLGEQLTPKSSEFQLMGISSSTSVKTYKYIGPIKGQYFFNRKIGDVIVGIKNGIIVTTFYNLVPEKGDVGVPKSTLDLVNANLPYPLAKRNSMYGANIDNITFTLSRENSPLTFNKDRIVFFTSVKNSFLRN